MEIVYLLSNPAMANLVKIGRTTANDVGVRLGQLYTTGVPFPFDLVFACKVPNSLEVENALHIAFAPNRINPKREFFSIEPERAIAILKLLHVQDATQEVAAMPTNISLNEVEAATQFKARRPRLNFKEMGIPDGANLSFIEGNATVTVVGDRKVMFGDEVTSLTAVTMQLLQIDYSIQPSPYWTYQTKTLKQIYDETYI